MGRGIDTRSTIAQSVDTRGVMVEKQTSILDYKSIILSLVYNRQIQSSGGIQIYLSSFLVHQTNSRNTCTLFYVVFMSQIYLLLGKQMRLCDIY